MTEPTAPPRRVRVCRVDRGAVRVLDADREQLTVPLRRDGTLEAAVGEPVPPAVGDRLLLDGDRALVLPRTSELSRGRVDGTSGAQVLAANVDVVVIAEHLDPEPSPGRVERLLTLTHGSGAQALVVLTKADLAAEPQAWVARMEGLARGLQVLAVSAVTGAGLPELDAALPAGATLAVVGPSGAGKSTLVNALAGQDVMATGGRRRDGRGRHTTTHRELVPISGGRVLVDTPGLRTIALVADARALEATFEDVAALARGCRFADCGHVAEPGCEVLAAVADGRLPARRLASWRSLAREARFQAVRADARLAAAERAEGKRRTREIRAYNAHRVKP